MKDAPQDAKRSYFPQAGFAALTRVSGTLARLIGTGIDGLGWVLGWLTVVMMLVTVLIVFMRYVLDIGSIFLQESVLYMHAGIIMLGLAYTLRQDAHVRVDVIYSRLGRRGQAWVNLIGSFLALFPLVALFGIGSWDYVSSSWAIREQSLEVSGIPAVFLLKTLIPLCALLLALQGVLGALAAIATLKGSQEPRAPRGSQSDSVS